MVGGDAQIVVGVGDLGLASEGFTEGEDPCGGGYFEQGRRCEPEFDGAEADRVERDCALVDFGDRGDAECFEAFDLAGDGDRGGQELGFGERAHVLGVQR
ncbi:hypothetical protein J2X34_001905 [Rhodococcus sp. BE178]